MFKSQYDDFAYLSNPLRVWEAIRYGEFARIACEVVWEEAGDLPIVLVGWGGDRWMHFADYCLAYDTRFPAHVIFTCHDNIIAPIGPNVSSPWGQLPPQRERWAIPWVECDLNDCWSRQPNVETLGVQAPDALQKGCQGLLTLQWRTRDVEEETGYIARFAWDPSLTPDKFYARIARQMFGPAQEAAMSERLGMLQRSGARWTGVSGCPECGRMRWTGWEPHIPFTIDGDAARYMRDFALRARDALAEIPVDAVQNTDAGMFHLREGEAETGGGRSDMTRPGVREFNEAAERLEALAHETDPAIIHQGMREIEEMVLQVRPRLIHFGIPPKCHPPMDEFWLRLHHLNRHGNVSDHLELLATVRGDLATLREHYVAQRYTHRLERLDYLLATMDFVTHFDAVAMLLATGEMVETALQAAEASGNSTTAARLAADAYDALVNAGMMDAVRALTDKLTTRCDFGVLATVNIKPLPRYWETIGKLEAYLPAVPPREINARAVDNAVWLAWSSSPRAAGFQLYRHRLDVGTIQCVNAAPLSPYTTMFIDHPPVPGAFRYTLTAITADGWESPHSHAVEIDMGPKSTPRLIAEKPASIAEVGQSIAINVVAIGDYAIARVRAFYRTDPNAEWKAIPLLRRFRHAYHGQLPILAKPGIISYYVEAIDAADHAVYWPPTAPNGTPWTVSIVKERRHSIRLRG